MDLSPENVYLIFLSTNISVSLYQKGCQFSCHLMISRNFKDMSLHIFLGRKLIPKGIAVQLPPNNNM